MGTGYSTDVEITLRVKVCIHDDYSNQHHVTQYDVEKFLVGVVSETVKKNSPRLDLNDIESESKEL